MEEQAQQIEEIFEQGVHDQIGGSGLGSPLMEEHVSHQNRTLWGDAWYRLRKNKLALVSLIWLTVLVLAAVTADLWVPHFFGNPMDINSTTAAAMKLHGSSLAHPFGTDELGRDIFGRVIYGARISLTVGVLSVIIEVFLGVLLGSLAGFYGKYIDAFIMRFTDIFLAFPYILFAVLILAMLPEELRGVVPVVLAIGFLGWPTFARLFRSSVLSIRENDYVAAGRALGASDARLMFRHIGPNAIAPVVVYGTMSVGGAILTEAALSYLGLGIQPPAISWGQMLESSKSYLVSNPALVFWPGVAIVVTVLAFTLLGDGIRDALDVKMKD